MAGNNVVIPLIDPQIICGQLHLENKKAFDWSCQGLLAFGCQKLVVIVDSNTAGNLQTLDKHKANVIKVRWSPQVYHCSIATPYVYRLASVDSASNCIVWDVAQATPISEFSLGNKSISDIQWISTNDSAQNLLAVLVSPNILTVWNTDTGTRVNRIIFSESVLSFTFNPFQPEQLLLVSHEYFIYISDFNPLRNLTSAGKKLYMNIPKQKHGRGGGNPPRRLLSGDEAEGNEEVLLLGDCHQVGFSPSVRHHLLLLFPREILVLDTEIMQAVGSIFLERGYPPFVQMCLCKQRDALYCLHENGSVSFRVRTPVEFPRNGTLQQEDFRHQISVTYDTHCHTESFRISKLCVPYSMTLCPTTETKAAILTSDGKIMFWEGLFERVGVYGQGEEGDVATPLTLLSALPDGDGYRKGEGSEGVTLSRNIAPHWFAPADSSLPYSLLTVRMVLTGVYYGLAPNSLTLRMCPPITNKNWKSYKYLVAIGNSGGGVQIFDMGSRQLYREMVVHTCPVKGIEWIGMDRLVTYGYPPPSNNSNQVRNELSVVLLKTGQVISLKKGDNGYSSPITGIRVSPHRNYIVVNFKESSPEFWDCRTYKMIRKMDSKPALFTATEWASSNAFPSLSSKSSGAMSPDILKDSAREIQQHKPTKEAMSVVDGQGYIHHFIVEGNKFVLGPIKSITTVLNHPAAMCWKDDMFVVGDLDGSLFTMEQKIKKMRYHDIAHRGAIRKIKFAPGKGNKKFLLLFNNGLGIRDMNDEAFSVFIKWSGKDDLRVLDMDWGSSDRPLLLMSDGTVRLYNVKLNETTSPSPAHFIENVFNPQCCLPQATFRLKSILQHQPWNVDYSLDHTQLDLMDPIEKALAGLLKAIPGNFKHELIHTPLGTPDRSLLTALLFGDEREAQFWSVATYYMLREKYRRQDPFYKMYIRSSYNPKSPTSDIIQPDSNASTSIGTSLKHSLEDLLQAESQDTPTSEDRVKKVVELLEVSDQKTWRLTPPLDLTFDLFIDQDIYQRYQLHRALCHDAHRHSTSQNKRCAECLLLLGQADRAVQLLLETDSNNPDYYPDALKACLAATIRSSGASQSTIKLVATNLIANSKLIEGVQLLCLIDKGLDACRYLQTYGDWHTSAWLAKSTLGEKEMTEVFLKWTDHLIACNYKSKALLVLLSLGQFMKVIETLYSMRHFDQAAVFTDCCLEYRVITRNKDTAPLIEAVFLEYARSLETLGLTRGMRYYCNLAGSKGSQLMDEHFSPQKSRVV